MASRRLFLKMSKFRQTIFIPSSAVHAIRAGTEPLLTFSFWLEPGDMLEINI